MKELFQLPGIIPVLNTPFTAENEIALGAVERHVLEALNASVSGFLVPAMASEVKNLSHDEKLSLVETALNAVNGKVPVFVGTAAPSVSDSTKIMKAYQEMGCQHFLVQIPFRNDLQFKQDFMKLMEPGPEVVMLQDWDASGYGLPDELILELFENVPAFRCLKVETVPAGIKYSRMLELTEGRLHVSGGWAVSQMPEALKRGVHAFMTTGMHWIYTEVYNRYQNGDIAGSTALFNQLLPVLAFSNQHLDISIHFFKRLLWRQGLYPTPDVRRPILPFDDVHQAFADEMIGIVMQLEETLKQSE